MEHNKKEYIAKVHSQNDNSTALDNLLIYIIYTFKNDLNLD